MARAIPKESWSQAEEYRTRLFYWQYMVSTWLSPGPSVLSHAGEADEGERWKAPSLESLHENGWFLEPENNLEQ